MTAGELIQSDIYQEFTEQIKAAKYERSNIRKDKCKREYERFFNYNIQMFKDKDTKNTNRDEDKIFIV